MLCGVSAFFICIFTEEFHLMFKVVDSFFYDIFGNGYLGKAACMIFTVFLAVALAVIFNILLRTVVSFFKSHSRVSFIRTASGYILRRNVVKHVSIFFFFFLISYFASRFGPAKEPVIRFSTVLMLSMIIFVFCDILDVAGDIYSEKPASRRRPIKGPLQVVKIVISLVMTLIIISVLIGQNPVVLISGIGAFTAILSIVFKDALLGLVAGVQITSENLISIGDWISIPSENVEGSVSDIALISVKVTAFDNTVYTVPAYTFLSQAFKNWHKTLNEGMRQGVFSFAADPDSIVMTEDGSTNLTRFRHDLADELKKDPDILPDKTLIIRTRSNEGGKGLPVEIIFMTRITDYDDYCDFVSGIGEKALAKAGGYGIRIYRALPSSPALS